MSSTRTAILCRFGELFLKGGNRRRFEQGLRRNVVRALAGIPDVAIQTPHGRIMIELPADAEVAACERLSRVFGMVSFSVGDIVPVDIDAINAAAVARAQGQIARRRPTSFKVDSRRSDKRFPLPSTEISRQVGAAVVAATGLAVDVHRPDLRIGVEVGERTAFVYAGVIAAPGGLPVGSAGRGLLLLSGGIDSPVAGWLAAKRGLTLNGVYFHSPPYIGEKSRDKVMSLGRILSRHQAMGTVTVVNFTETQKQLRDAGPAPLAVVLYRRMMMRIADRVADDLGTEVLITGENVGQVASQTVQNMAVIDAAAKRLVLRPLVTYDKVETTSLAQRIGTYETSIQPFEDCCSLFVPPHPATAARLQDVERAEAKLDIPALVEVSFNSAERITVDGL